MILLFEVPGPHHKNKQARAVFPKEFLGSLDIVSDG